MGLAENIKYLRLSQGRTLCDVRRQLGMANTKPLQNWEEGITTPSLFYCTLLADVYKVSLDEMCLSRPAVPCKHLECQPLGARIRLYRKLNGLQQAELAEKIGVKQTFISRWELGYQDPILDYAIKLSDALGISLDELVGREVKNGETTVL